MRTRLLLLLGSVLLSVTSIFSQDYEIQVYESGTQPKGVTDIEIHSNYTFDGSKKSVTNEMYTNNLSNNTLEITHGFTNHFESALYVFTTIGNDNRSGLAGIRIRNRIGYEQSSSLPVGLSLSTEFGKEDPRYFNHTWGLEVKSIIDRRLGKLYLCVNPTFEIAWDKHFGNTVAAIEPCYTVKFDYTDKVTPGIEYYQDLGSFKHIESYNKQGHVLYPTVDIALANKFTINAGLGFKLNKSSDNLVFKFILGKAF